MTVGELDQLSQASAMGALGACCGSRAWIAEMVERRPFGSIERVRREAEQVWTGLTRNDWLEAFSHHPRIGESASRQNAQGQAWSDQEQAGLAEASDPVRRELERVNHAYHTRFGYIYIVCASGRGAEELLALARERLTHEPDEELRVAAAEQLKITLLRLDRLLSTEA